MERPTREALVGLNSARIDYPSHLLFLIRPLEFLGIHYEKIL
jgi:hypothetical protein